MAGNENHLFSYYIHSLIYILAFVVAIHGYYIIAREQITETNMQQLTKDFTLLIAVFKKKKKLPLIFFSSSLLKQLAW